MYSEEIDRIDIFINFGIFILVWALLTSLLAMIGHKKPYKIRFLYVGAVVFTVLSLYWYFHFKNTNFRMELVSIMFFSFTQLIAIVVQFSIIFYFYLKNPIRSLGILLVAQSLLLIVALLGIIFTNHGFYIPIPSLALNTFMNWGFFFGNTLLVIGIYFLLKQNATLGNNTDNDDALIDK